MSRTAPVVAIVAALTAATPARADPGSGPSCRGHSTPVAAAELDSARLAWRYFESNYQAATGFVNAVDGYPATTLWDLGSTIFATIAARELELVTAEAFDARISTLLRSLETIPLFDDELPNKSYDTTTGRMTDYANHPVEAGIGFSAIDVGRLVSALSLLACLHPQYLNAIQRVLARWRYCNLVHDGQMYGAARDPGGKTRRDQEGRLGYEQYAAQALALLGFRLDAVARYDHFAAEERIEGVAVPYDTRDPRRYGALNPVVTDPWVLAAFEFGRDRGNAAGIQRIFDVQRRRWEQTGVPTAVGEDHVDVAPWFVYDTILEGGVPWRTVSPDGADVPALHQLSTKAAFALAALHPHDAYAGVLREAIAPARAPDRGWYAGIFADGRINRSLNANTNGMILETILARHLGPLHRACKACGRAFAWPAALAPADARRACFPLPGVPDPVARREPGPVASAPASTPGPTAAAPVVRVSGALFSSYRDVDGPASGAIATWTPWSYFFVRAGGAVTPLWKGGVARAVWGVGYDDWHDATFSIQVNNWGPLQPYSQDVGLRGAQLDLAFKVPRLCAGPVCVATLPFATVPFAGGPYVGARANVTLWEKLFVMGGLGWVIPDVFRPPAGTPQWRPMFGVGLWDWRPGTIFVHYYNWGPSSALSNGVITVGMNWAF